MTRLYRCSDTQTQCTGVEPGWIGVRREVYSTCTLKSAENESVVEWALNKFGDEWELMPPVCHAVCMRTKCRCTPCITTPATYTPCPHMPTMRTSWSSSIRHFIVACTQTDNVCTFCRRTQPCTAPSRPPTAHLIHDGCRIIVILSDFSWLYFPGDKLRIVTSRENCIVIMCAHSTSTHKRVYVVQPVGQHFSFEQKWKMAIMLSCTCTTYRSAWPGKCL
jgi:hypothetical protein